LWSIGGYIRAVVVGRKKEKTLLPVGIFAGGHPWPPPTPKAEPRPKAADFEEVIQGCPLKACSAFSVPGLVKIPNAFAFFSFFLDQLSSSYALQGKSFDEFHLRSAEIRKKREVVMNNLNMFPMKNK